VAEIEGGYECDDCGARFGEDNLYRAPEPLAPGGSLPRQADPTGADRGQESVNVVVSPHTFDAVSLLEYLNRAGATVEEGESGEPVLFWPAFRPAGLVPELRQAVELHGPQILRWLRACRQAAGIGRDRYRAPEPDQKPTWEVWGTGAVEKDETKVVNVAGDGQVYLVHEAKLKLFSSYSAGDSELCEAWFETGRKVRRAPFQRGSWVGHEFVPEPA
jgi:hypothetical protein